LQSFAAHGFFDPPLFALGLKSRLLRLELSFAHQIDLDHQILFEDHFAHREEK